MRPTRKVSYGVKALFDLAFHCPGGAGQAREIAARQGIPLRYLEQILRDLRRAGLVDAKRGPRGGYALARPPRELRLSEVLQALATEADAAADERDGIATIDATQAPDVPELFFRDVTARFDAICAAVTLQDMVERATTLGLRQAPALAPMYFI